MALQQIIQHTTGAYSQYWRIVKTDLNYATLLGEIEIWGYVSEQARLENKEKLDTRLFTVNSDNFNLYFIPDAINPQDINQVKNAYIFVKTQQEFITATDIL